MRRRKCLPLASPLILLLTLVLLSPPAHACTAFIVKKAGVVLAGNNEDNQAANLRVWFIPGDASRHGMAYFGTFDPSGKTEEREGGMNDQGLFIDGFSVPRFVPLREDGIHVGDLPFDFVDKALAECASVGEVEALARKHRIRLYSAMWMFGDRNGDSIIIEGEPIVRGDGRFQVCTNFRQSAPEDCGAACRRYRTTVGMLSRLGTPTVGACRDILRAVSGRNTQYSYVLDLNARRIHYFHFQDFSRELVFDLDAELAKGRHSLDTVPLFPPKLAARMSASRQALYFVSLALWFLLFSLLFWGARTLLRRLKKNVTGRVPDRRAPPCAGLVLGALSLLQAAYLLVLLLAPQRIPIQGGSPGSPWIAGALRLSPWLLALLTAALLVVCWQAWRRRSWTLAGRIHCTVLALSSLAVMALLVSWGVI